MTLARVALDGVRCFREPRSIKINARDLLITGANGSGKTSFLETIYTTVRGRSFRTSDLRKMLTDDREVMESRIDFQSTNGTLIPIKLRYHGLTRETTVERNAVPVTHAELSRQYPLIHIDRDIVAIVSGEPSRRRAILDWVSFHVEHDHGLRMKAYRKSLLQWRECLRKSMKGEDAWWNQVIQAATDVEKTREISFLALLPFLEKHVTRLLPDHRIRVSYASSTHLEKDYAAIRNDFLSGEKIRWGPQYSMLAITVGDSTDTRGHLSRGQQKRLAVALLWSAMDTVSSMTGKDVLVLFDDFSSDLDSRAKKEVLEFILSGSHQSIVTSQDEGLFSGLSFSSCSTWNIG
jgi:DNA replication and repair protein RecF